MVGDYNMTQLPHGYEPHELPADYTGKLWIEGQLRQMQCSNEALLRQALEALVRAQPQILGVLPQQDVEYAIAALRERLGET